MPAVAATIASTPVPVRAVYHMPCCAPPASLHPVHCVHACIVRLRRLSRGRLISEHTEQEGPHASTREQAGMRPQSKNAVLFEYMYSRSESTRIATRMSMDGCCVLGSVRADRGASSVLL